MPRANLKTMLNSKTTEDNYPANEVASQAPCESPIAGARGLDNLKVSKFYPRGSVLFVEGERPSGVYVLCAGRAKISIGSAEGKTFVLRIAQPGELLGMNATLTGEPYGATVETLERCRIDFIARGDLLKLLDRDKGACLGVAHALSRKLRGVVEHARLLFLSHSASEKVARLLVSWCDESQTHSPGNTHRVWPHA